MSRNAYARGLVTVLGCCLLLQGTAAFAHHSFAPYEPKLQIKLSGVVSEFRWGNPHVYITLDAADEKGVQKHWLIECANPSILNRVGWKFNVLKAGDKVTVIVAPMRNGDPAALLKQITLPDGRKLSDGGPAGAATIE